MFRFKRRLFVYPGQLAILVGASAMITFIFSNIAEEIGGERKHAVEFALNDNRSRAQIFQEYVLRTLEVGDVATKHVASQLESRAMSPKVAIDIINASILGKIGYVEGTLARIPGGTRVQSGDVSLPEASWRQLESFAQQQGTEVAVSPPVRTSDGKQLLALTRRLKGRNGQGFIGIAFKPHHLTDFSREVRFGQSDLVSLIGLDGITRARREGARLSSGENLAGRLVMKQQQRAPNGTYYGPSSLDGVWRIFSHRRIERYGLFATSGVSMEAILASLDARRRFQIPMLAAAVAAIITAASLIIIAIGQRKRQLAVLSKANLRLNEAQRIGEMGDWDYWPATDELAWSDYLCALYGRDRSIRITSLAAIRTALDDANFKTVEKGLEAVIRTGEPGSWDIVARLQDDRRSHRRIIAVPVCDKAGNVCRIHGVDQSIDQERHLAQLQERLATHARLDAMNALAATLAHELNQPLGVAANFLAAARRRLKRDPSDVESFRFLDQAEEQIVAVAEIIGAARQALSGRSLDRVRYAISDTVERAKLLLRGHPAEHGAKIDVRIHPDATEAAGNGALIKQVLHNLLKNSLEAIPSQRSGEITISTAPDKGGRILFVSVSDNGAGIANGIEPFAALSTQKPEGLGLGLALSRTIIEAQGGKIWVEQTGSRGTTFTFSLPTPS